VTNHVSRDRKITSSALAVLFGILILLYSRSTMRLLGFSDRLDQRCVFYANILCYALFGVVVLWRGARLRLLLSDTYAQIVLLSYCATVIPNILSAYILYSQPLMGIIRTFFWYGGWALLLALVLWGPDVVLAFRLLRVFALLGVVAAAFACVVALFPGLRALLVSDTVVSERFGLTRIIILPGPVQFALYFYLASLLYVKQDRAKALQFIFCVIVTFAYIFFVCLTRETILATCVVLVYFALRYLPERIRRGHILIGLSLVLVILYAAGGFSIVKRSVQSAYEGHSGDVSSFNSRVDSIRYSWNQLRETGYVGTGKISTVHGGRNPIRDAFEAGEVNWVDVGILGTVGLYGIPVLLLVAAAFWKSFKDVALIRDSSLAPPMVASAIAIELFILANILEFGVTFFHEVTAYYYALVFFVLSTFTSQARKAHAVGYPRVKGSIRVPLHGTRAIRAYNRSTGVFASPPLICENRCIVAYRSWF